MNSGFPAASLGQIKKEGMSRWAERKEVTLFFLKGGVANVVLLDRLQVERAAPSFFAINRGALKESMAASGNVVHATRKLSAANPL